MKPDSICFKNAECSHKGMSRIDFVVAISANQEQMSNVPAREQRLEKVQGCRIHPLKVVEKNHQRMFFAGDRPDEVLEDEAETVLGFCRRQHRRSRLLAND